VTDGKRGGIPHQRRKDARFQKNGRMERTKCGVNEKAAREEREGGKDTGPELQIFWNYWGVGVRLAERSEEKKEFKAKKFRACPFKKRVKEIREGTRKRKGPSPSSTQRGRRRPTGGRKEKNAESVEESAEGETLNG